MDGLWVAAVGAVACLVTALVGFLAYLDARRGPRVGRATRAVAPVPVRHNLPRRESFVGREGDKKALLKTLMSRSPIVSVEGRGGVGKTALARAVAWDIVDGTTATQDESGREGPAFEAVIWVEHNKDGQLTLDGLLDTAAAVLDYPRMLAPDIKRKEAARRLEEVRSLLIIDNFDTSRDTEVAEFIKNHVRWSKSKTLLTCRDKRFREAHSVPLAEMQFEDSRDYLASFQVPALATASLDELSALHTVTGGNPLAMKCVAGWLKDGDALSRAIENLQQAKPKELFDHMFGQSWARLQGDHGCSQVLKSMPLFTGPACEAAILGVSRLSPATLRHSLEHLSGVFLIDKFSEHGLTEAASGSDALRYSVHPLIRAFAKTKLLEDPADARRAHERFVSHFLGCSKEWADTWTKQENVIRLKGERENLLEAAHLAYSLASRHGDPGYLSAVVDFSNSLYPFLWGRGYWNEVIRLCGRATFAARRLGDFRNLARQWAWIGRVHVSREDFSRAERFPVLCWDAARRDSGGRSTLAIATRLDGEIALAKEHYEDAETLLAEALDYAPSSADVDGRAAILVELGRAFMGHGKFKLARKRFEEALDLDVASGTIEGQAISMAFLGQALYLLKEYGEAREQLQGGLRLAAQVGRPDTLGECQLGLAHLHRRKGQFARARRLANDALENFQRLRMSKKAEEARALLERVGL